MLCCEQCRSRDEPSLLWQSLSWSGLEARYMVVHQHLREEVEGVLRAEMSVLAGDESAPLLLCLSELAGFTVSERKTRWGPA